VITFEEAKQYSDRMMWDCILHPFVHHIIETNGYSLASGLEWAFQQVEVPRLIILSWSLAAVLEKHRREMFKKWEKFPFQANFSNMEARTWGYIGTYRDVDVVGLFSTDKGWISSERQASLLGGDNSVFLKVAE